MGNDMYKELDAALIQNLENIDFDRDKPYLISGRESWSINQLIEEVKNGTMKGLELRKGILSLTIDLLIRGKIQLPDHY